MIQEHRALFVIFGGTGDLAKRKLYPSLFRLFRKGNIATHFAVIGTARREWSNDYFREIIKTAIEPLEPTKEEEEAFVQHFYYQSHNVTNTEEYTVIKTLADRLDEQYEIGGNRLFYLAMAPNFFGVITRHLKSEEIITNNGFNRLVIEKPFGSDYESARLLNEEIREVFEEDQIFRIDHYLGKEMIQNISAIRFANNMIESLWNNRYIDNVQVTLAESLGVEERGGYYDKSGALKDMIQNHALQIVSLLAMEPPRIFDDEEIRQEKIIALRSIRILSEAEVDQFFVRGQYSAGKLKDDTFAAYHDELNVAPDSRTETFVAGKLLIDNFRWAGVPFYIRSGKRLTEKGTRINIVFKPVPVNIFRENEATRKIKGKDVLTIYIQPTEGFSLTMNGKEIGPSFSLAPIKLDYRHSADALENSPEAYERLLLDCLNGDATNFTHWDEVAQSWRIVDVIRQAWDKDTSAIPSYAAGTMGPDEAFQLLEKDGHDWIWQPDAWYRERGYLTD